MRTTANDRGMEEDRLVVVNDGPFFFFFPCNHIKNIKKSFLAK
jgi:hypothetical protein